ncbi:MAG: mannose-6-phosphate isomerase, class I, partial [Acidimicrobiales bacterium]
ELLGVPATGEPCAELWFGAHPSAPALVGAAGEPLDAVIALDPVSALGSDVADRFTGLPFLMKILAAARPLSLQAHPSASQAATGFDRESARGVPLDSPERCFRDRSHKPEVICAIGGFSALCGFRDPVASLELLDSLPTPALDPVRRRLESPASDGRAAILAALRWLLTLPAAEGAELVSALTDALAHAGGDGSPELNEVARLGASFPGDAGVVVALLMNLVELGPGEALFLGPGTLHAYLRGTGVEVMANSDNVVRGGLTSKPVDATTLLEIVDPTPGGPEVLDPEPVGGVARYETPAAEFVLERVEIAGEWTLAPGPAILLCTGGAVTVGPHALARGGAVWVRADEPAATISGSGTLFRCRTPAREGGRRVGP